MAYEAWLAGIAAGIEKKHSNRLIQQGVKLRAGFAPPQKPDPHASLADPTSPEFNPLEYKRLTGSLPKVAQEAARKLKLIED